MTWVFFCLLSWPPLFLNEEPTYSQVIQWLQQNKVDLQEWRIDKDEPDLMNAKPTIRQFPLTNDPRRIVTIYLPYAAFGIFLVDTSGQVRIPIIYPSDALISNPMAVKINGRNYFSIRESSKAGTGIHATTARAWHIREDGISLSWLGPDVFFPEVSDNQWLRAGLSGFEETSPGHLVANFTVFTASTSSDIRRPLFIVREGPLYQYFDPDDEDFKQITGFLKVFCYLRMVEGAEVSPELRDLLEKHACADK